MKKILLTIIMTVWAFVCYGQKQDFIVVKKSDYTNVRLNVDDISRITFEQQTMVIRKTDNTVLRINVEDIVRGLFESEYTNPVGTLSETVDLGLPSGVRWAKWNLGATNASEYGGYYGWGDATGQNTSTNLSDYPSVNPPMEISGTQYDIAHLLWGGQWRMPTYEDISELYEKCDVYKSGNDIEIVGPNGNSIILPLAGSREGTEFYDVGNYAYYWSGTIHPDDNQCAWLFTVDLPNGKYGVAGGSRYFGLSIRPVWGTPKTVSVETGSATDITQNSAYVGGTVSGVSSRVTAGILYGTSSTLNNNSQKATTTTMGGYTVSITGLSAGTTYYYRAFAEVDGEYYYGETKSFTTVAPPAVSISVTTNAATNIKETTATLNGLVSASNTTKSYTAGFFLSTTNSTPTSNSYTKKVTYSSSSPSGSFSVSASGLSSGTKYYCRAYVLYDGEYYYGTTKNFTTLAGTTGTLNGHDWVDLGLPSGTKWATCNIGATSPEQYGDYFAWGETETKSTFTRDNYQYRVSETQVAYVGMDISGTNKDAAHVKWGSTWKMPTKAQKEELIEKCEFEPYWQNDVKGTKLTGPNGNSIFLPYGGYIMGSSSEKVGEDGYYRLATGCQNGYNGMVMHARCWLYYGNDDNIEITWDGEFWAGNLIRPVTK